MFASSKPEEKKMLATKLVWLFLEEAENNKTQQFLQNNFPCLFSPFDCSRLSNLSGKLIFPPSICTFNSKKGKEEMFLNF